MPFVKVIKNKAYFKRFQTKFKRRREGKTDYRARKRLVAQPKNKYNSPRYRFVVRFTNKICICQVIYAEMDSDKVLESAYSSELPRYGLKVGLKNYCAAYCTGLLLARRLLKKLNLDEMYQGAEAGSEVQSVKYGKRTLFVEDLEWETERRPFRCNLDVGITATSTGARIFGALKGASDGGLDIPHSHKRFPGYDPESKEYSVEEHRARIFGEHVSDYMTYLEEKDTEAYNMQFAKYIEAEIEPDDLEELYESVHEAIRADPSFQKCPDYEKPDTVAPRQRRRTLKQRKFRVQQKKRWQAWKTEQEEEDEDDEDEDDE
jgi:large subunit ribosomal protein L5e